MADRLRNHVAKAPRDRLTAPDPQNRGYFFPGEVARLLDLAEVDYRQLRRLFRLVRGQAGGNAPDRKWARFTLRDMAALRIAVDLCRTSTNGTMTPSLVIKPLEEACKALRSRGVQNPLLDVPLRREGLIVYAEIDGVLVNPKSGQMCLRDMHDRVWNYLDQADALIGIEKPPYRRRLRSALANERQQRADPNKPRVAGARMVAGTTVSAHTVTKRDAL